MDAPPVASALRRFYGPWEETLRALLPAPGARVLAGISGGCDSVCLAALLRIARARGLLDLALGHIHHGLRPEADEEETFVRELGRAWGLAVHVRRVRARETARARGWSLEQAARAERLAALRELCREADCSVLALGHQMDDQAETVLLRLLRGAGPRGLGAMAPRRRLSDGEADGEPITLIRPLLGCRRAEISGVARALGLAWREDASNRDRRHPRNRIRHELLPLLERDYNPRIVPALAELAGWQRLESGAVAQAAEAAAARCVSDATPSGVEVDLEGLSGEADAVATRVLWIAYQRLVGSGGVLASPHVAELLDLIRCGPGGPALEIHLPGAVRARRERAILRLEYHRPRPGRKRRGRPRESS